MLMKTNNSTTTNSHSTIENGCFTLKSSRTVKIRSVITGTAAWLAICAIFLIWHELNVEFITEMCSCLVVGAIVTTVSLSTTTLRIDGNTFTTTEPIAFWIKTTAKVSDISHVEVKDTFWGKRLTIYYGDRLSTTIYPDNTDKITDFMKSRNIEVRL